MNRWNNWRRPWRRQTPPHELSDPNINDFDHKWRLDEEDIDFTNPYNFLSRIDWREYSPAAVKGIAAKAKQLEPESETRYCQLTVFTERKPEDQAKMRYMTFNGKRWVGHDLAQPITSIARSDKVPPEDRKGIPLPVLPGSPGKCLKCQMVYRRRVSSSSSESTSASTQTTKTLPTAKPTSVSPTAKSSPKKKTKIAARTLDTEKAPAGFSSPTAREQASEPGEEGERTLRPMEIEEVMSPLLPQIFRVAEPAESGWQTGSVSDGTLGVLPVVAGAPEVSSHEPSPIKVPATVPSPISIVSAPAGPTPLRKIMEEQAQEREAVSVGPKEP